MRMTRAAIVLAGGDPVEPGIKRFLPGGADVIAADSGVHNAAVLGLRVDRIVGDLDSADPAAVHDARVRGATIEVHPVDKDATDLELALAAAQSRGAARILVVGGAGGRLDHFLANVAVIAAPRFAGVEIDAIFGDAQVAVVQGGRPPHAVRGEPGSIVTLLPIGGDARGITTTGLEYPLDDEDLPAGTTRGVSNVLVGERATVELARGTLLVVQPEGGAR